MANSQLHEMTYFSSLFVRSIAHELLRLIVLELLYIFKHFSVFQPNIDTDIS